MSVRNAWLGLSLRVSPKRRVVCRRWGWHGDSPARAPITMVKDEINVPIALSAFRDNPITMSQSSAFVAAARSSSESHPALWAFSFIGWSQWITSYAHSHSLSLTHTDTQTDTQFKRPKSRTFVPKNTECYRDVNLILFSTDTDTDTHTQTHTQRLHHSEYSTHTLSRNRISYIHYCLFIIGCQGRGCHLSSSHQLSFLH